MHQLPSMFVLCVALAGCTSMNTAPPVSSNAISQVRAGVTDKETILKLLGSPTNRGIEANGDEMWHYYNVQITGVAIVAQMDAQDHKIYFRGNVVSRCQFNTHQNQTVVAPVPAATITRTSPSMQMSDCGEIPASRPAGQTKKR